MAKTHKDEIVIPYAVVTEQVVLTAACVDEAACEELSRRVSEDHFLVLEHKTLWRGRMEMHRRKLSFDLATMKQLEPDADVGLMADYIEARPDRPPNLDHHVEALFWDHARVTAAAGPVSELLQALRNPKEERERVKALAKSVSEALDGYQDRRHLLEPAGLVQAQVAEMRRRREGEAVHPYGIHGLDRYEDGEPRMVPGAMRGMVTVVTGISGSGKSPLAANMALGLAEQHRRVLYGAWEVSGGMTLEWLSLLSLGYNRADFQLGKFDDEQLEAVEERMALMTQQVTFLANPFNRQRGERRGKGVNDRNLDVIHGYIADSGCDVFVADLWERCLGDSDPDEEKHALFRVKAMAEECQVHMILVAQQRLKDIEQRPDKRPTREGVKGSSAWVEVADTMIGTNRPALWRNVPDDVMELHVLKQRVGKWPLLVEMDWSPTHYSLSGGRSQAYRHSVEGDDADGGVFAPPRPQRGRFGKGRT